MLAGELKAMRIVATLLALSLMLGEAFRSWGVGRPIHHWIDDQILGALLLVGVWMLRRPTPAAFAMMGAGWGFSAGMLFPSFFGKLFDPASSNPGNFDNEVLTALIGLAFATSIVGLLWTIRLARG